MYHLQGCTCFIFTHQVRINFYCKNLALLLNENDLIVCCIFSAGNADMVSVMLEAGCATSVKMGIPATVTPLSLATDLGLEDIIELLSKSSLS